MIASSRCARSTKPRGDLHAIADEIEALKLQVSRLPDRVWLSWLLFLGFGSVWALIAALALRLTR